MFRVRMLLTICAVILVLIPAQSFSQQPKRQRDYDFIQAKIKSFEGYQNDFIDFAKPSSSTALNFEIPMSLFRVANLVYYNLYSVRTLLDILNNVSCEPDRAKVRSIVLDTIRFYAKVINVCIDQVNNDISKTKILTVEHSGTRMKEDLREIKTLFESIQLP